jgi:signal transduction histidine kinase/ActR/RegA family two-component response regulator
MSRAASAGRRRPPACIIAPDVEGSMEWRVSLDEVFDRIGIGLTGWDAGGALMRASERARQLIGPALREGATLTEVFGDDAARIEAAAGTGGVVELTRGERVLAVRPARREDQLFAAVQDLTDEARLRDQVRRSDEQLAEAQALTHIGSWDWEIPTDSVTWSDELYRIFGLTPRSFGATAAAYLERVHPDDRAAARVAIERTVATGEPFDHLERIVRSDGAGAVLQSRGRRVDGGRRGPTLYGTCRDVTEEHRLREQVHRMQRMDAVGRLAGGIAHDFNNLLTVILSHAELATRRLDDPERVRDGLDGIRSAAASAAVMTRQLLMFARGESVARAVIDVGQAVRASEHLIRRLIEEDLDVVLEVPAELGRARISAAQLEQVLVNLVVNARDAMDRGGTVTVRGRRAVHDGGALDAPPGDYIVIEVVDDGPGMAADVALRVFEPFFTTKPAGQGTGLGLSTVYGIVKSVGGEVELESAVGAGTTVRVWLPRTDEDTAPAPEPSLSLGGTSRARILVVEDAPPLRELLDRVLRDAGYRVKLAADPAAAVAQLEASTAAPAVLLTDVVLPGMSGVELAATARARFPGLPVVFMSGYPRAGQRVPRIELDDRTRFLAKPFTPDELFNAIQLAIGDAPGE